MRSLSGCLSFCREPDEVSSLIHEGLRRKTGRLVQQYSSSDEWLSQTDQPPTLQPARACQLRTQKLKNVPKPVLGSRDTGQRFEGDGTNSRLHTFARGTAVAVTAVARDD